MPVHVPRVRSSAKAPTGGAPRRKGEGDSAGHGGGSRTEEKAKLTAPRVWHGPTVRCAVVVPASDRDSYF